MKYIILILFMFGCTESKQDFWDARLQKWENLKQRHDYESIKSIASRFAEKNTTCHFKLDLEDIIDNWARCNISACNDAHQDCGNFDVYLKFENDKWKPIAMLNYENVFNSNLIPCFMIRGMSEEDCKVRDEARQYKGRS